MMWGYMSWDGVGYCCKIDGRMDAEPYSQNLEDEVQNSLEWWGKGPADIIFQQDNDPKHTSKLAKSWFKDHGIQVRETLQNLQISTLLNISGFTSKNSC